VKINRWIAPLLVMVISFIFLREMILDGKIPESADMFHRMPLDRWVEHYTANNEDMPQWYPHLFGGMPSYGGFIHAPADPLRKVFDALDFNWGMRYWLHFVIAGVGMYCYLRRRNLSKIPSLFGSLAFSLSPYMFGLINAGHPAKLYAITFIPLVILFAEKVIAERKLRNALGLALFTALQLWTKHVQICYYTWMLIVFFWFWQEGKELKSGTFKAKLFGRRLAILSVAVLLSGILVADPYLPIYEFQGHSTRGAASSLPSVGEARKGTSWDYATQWSFHPKETISLFFPYFYGLQNFPSRDLNSQAYWGQMPFTQSTHYMGLIVLVLAVVGFLIQKADSFKISVAVASMIILVIGFGEHFPFLYWPLFELAPMFGRFRVPSMIYILLPFTCSILASIAIHDFANAAKNSLSENTQMRIIITLGFMVGLSIFLFLFGSEMLSFSKLGEATRFQPPLIEQIKDVRIHLFQTGALLALLLSSGLFLTVWLTLKEKITGFVMGGVLLGLTIVDLWVVNSEFIHLRSERAAVSGYRPTETVKFLDSNRGLHRIMPIEQFNTNWYAYFGHSTVGGYRPVKLRSYQDILDAQALNNGAVQDMLNVRYVITDKILPGNQYQLVHQSDMKVYEKSSVLPKAWFVDNTLSAKDMSESLDIILERDFNPRNTAVVQGFDMNSGLAVGSVKVTEYSENRITLETQSEGDGFLVLSENYYGPGWKASIGGVETKIYRTNHLLRGVNVPSGNHTIMFTADHSTFRTARLISLLGIVLTLTAIGVLYCSDLRSFIKYIEREKERIGG
tara:strand:+ start:1085 stop:3463 length:2379 start_codon:yes stop_codon:yes gene_type:complete